MSAEERTQLKDYIMKGRGSSSSYSDVMWGMVAMMAVGGALILISLVIGLITCLIARRSEVRSQYLILSAQYMY